MNEGPDGDVPNQGLSGGELAALYDARLAADAYRNQVWSVLCRHHFQRWVDRSSTFVEVGAGHCHWVNHIEAEQRIAVDLNPELPRYVGDGVVAMRGSATELVGIGDGTVGTVAMSNLLEHLTRDQIMDALREVRRVLKPGGRLLILQPNIRFCARDYWMFFDHITPIDDRALVEALELVGLTPEVVTPRFLPFTMVGRRRTPPFLLRTYLRVPLLWRFFGQQAFVVGRNEGGAAAA